jgi:SOS-response transcriptional repressors (RecA-mediated autopeptidases)
MLLSGIKEDSLLIIDRSLERKNGDIVVASMGDEFFCGKIIIGGRKLLIPNGLINKTKDLAILLDLEILGVVSSSINIY